MVDFVSLAHEFGVWAAIVLGIVVTFGMWIPKVAGWFSTKIANPIVDSYVETIRKLGSTQETMGQAIIAIKARVDKNSEDLTQLGMWSGKQDTEMRKAISEEMIRIWQERRMRDKEQL